MQKSPFRGSITALITPFSNGRVDEKKFADLVDWQIAEGTQGLVPCGTTGESPTLTHSEHQHLVELCIKTAKGKIPVMAGCGSNSTAEAVSLTQHAEKVGADAALHVTPYYNKPTQEGLFQHFKAVHDQSKLPIFIYNIPGRSVVNMTTETMQRLSLLPRIVGVKDATGDLARPLKTRAACGTDFVQLSGEDATAIPFLAAGGVGCISVTSNIAPALCREMHEAWEKQDFKRAEQISDLLLPLHEALFVETSPGPVKYAASLLGLCLYEMRLPLVPVDRKTEVSVKAAMVTLGLTKLEAKMRTAIS